MSLAAMDAALKSRACSGRLDAGIAGDIPSLLSGDAGQPCSATLTRTAAFRAKDRRDLPVNCVRRSIELCVNEISPAQSTRVSKSLSTGLYGINRLIMSIDQRQMVKRGRPGDGSNRPRIQSYEYLGQFELDPAWCRPAWPKSSRPRLPALIGPVARPRFE